mmetsp:Transcript_26862/g.64086  ORF Transcript_26862/g.64086 Transcript_26862/m.64086 type:complete len:116 (-) Transcript_26862:406-753(-)
MKFLSHPLTLIFVCTLYHPFKTKLTTNRTKTFFKTKMSTEETKPTEEHHGIIDTVKDIGKKVIDATILDTHPKIIDGAVRADGKFVKEVVNATVLNDHPSGAPVDHTMGKHLEKK